MSVRQHAYVCELGPIDSERLPADVRVRCDATSATGRGRCTKRATWGVRYPWGAACLCEQDYRKECP